MYRFRTIRNKKEERKNRKGFTLIEVLLYVGVSAFLIAGLIGMFSMLIRSRAESEARSELTSQGQFVMQVLTREIRNADGFNSPTIGNSDTSLSLVASLPAEDPIIFAEDGSGGITITRGAGGSVDLLSDKVLISSLNFENFAEPGTQGVISFTFTLSAANLGNIQELDISENYYGSQAIK